VDIRWLTIFIDRTGSGFDSALEFWSAVTASTPSPFRGDGEQFTTLIPDNGGDAHVRLQRLQEGEGGNHLDLHVDDVEEALTEALGVGAVEVGRGHHHVFLNSPGGYPFCLVPHSGEKTRTAPVEGGQPNTRTVIDQLCIDVPTDRFDDETSFWTALLNWPLQWSPEPGFANLARPRRLPVRLLFQRLEDDGRSETTAHLDLACDNVTEATTAHEALGAEVVAELPRWTVMNDPSGHSYCLTARDPDTGKLR
jgi:hypothetical protein